MTIFYKLLRFLCLCVVMQKGSWTPQQENIAKKKKKEAGSPKPEWLKQWTISKGWMHNRSHLLNLGVSREVVSREEGGTRANSCLSLQMVLLSE